jgi:predicted RNase H-like nuclease (RuvC/YqgF family)
MHNRLRRGISTQDTSYSRNNENADKHQNKMHEVHGSVKSNNDANMDDALMSLISKYEEKLMEYEGKICMLENKLAESQATIKETVREKKSHFKV